MTSPSSAHVNGNPEITYDDDDDDDKLNRSFMDIMILRTSNLLRSSY
jgi:hypothetical protein